MKIIITEEQNDKLTRRVKMMVEKLGLQHAIEILGGNTNIIKHAYENNPIEFMDNFKDLETVIKPDEPNSIFYKKNGKGLMLQDDEHKQFWFQYDEIWSFFDIVFDMEYEEIQRILSQWLEETLNLKGYTPGLLTLLKKIMLEETLNLEGYRPSIIFEDRMILLEDNLNLKG